MDKKIVGLVGAIAAIAAPEAVQAMPATAANAGVILHVQSYVELLDPIPNAASLLSAVDSAPATDALKVQKVQYYHHHHHHHHWRRRHYHHHHHHHHRGYGYRY